MHPLDIIYGIKNSEPILVQCHIYIPPENARKPMVF